jgi:hypothetical protein
VICGAKFDPLRAAITCSPECSRERRRQTQFDFNHGPGRESHLKYRQRNRDVRRAQSKKFRDENPTYMRDYHARSEQRALKAQDKNL